MVCQGIRVEHFRNIPTAKVTFCEGVNVLYGRNAQGKTNLLEAIGLASMGRSFRGAKDGEMIAFGSDNAMISADYFRDGSYRMENVTMKLSSAGRRRIEQNRVTIEKLSEMIGQYRTVLFCPEHLAVVKEGPALRRSFLDMALSQLRPLYLRSLQRYMQILKERNRLIKNGLEDRRTFDSTIDFWSAQLAHEAAVITGFRMRYLDELAKWVNRIFVEMTDGAEAVELRYFSSVDKEGAFSSYYQDERSMELMYQEKMICDKERELYVGSSLCGIHRDDIQFILNGEDARSFASQGQQRSLALALKIAEGEICQEETGEYPVFLFDDVFSELDGERRAYLCEKIKGKQIIMTSCEPVTFCKAKKVRVEKGCFYDEGF